MESQQLFVSLLFGAPWPLVFVAQGAVATCWGAQGRVWLFVSVRFRFGLVLVQYSRALGELVYSPPDRKGLLDFMLESTFAMLLHHAPTQYPARAALQWIPPSIPPEQLVSGSRRVSRQSCLPVDPAQYPARAARQWIPPSIPPERLASGSRRVSRRAARQWIPPSILPERLASGSRRVFCQRGSPVDPAEYPARVARQWIPRSSSPVDPAEYPAEYPTQ